VTLLDALPAELAAGAAASLLATLRLLPVALVSPFLGGPLVPAPVRVALALGLGAAAASLAPGAAPASALELAAAGVRELAAGTVLALLVSAPVEAARAAGRLADTYRGATLAELHVAPIRQLESASGDLLSQWVVVLAAWAGADRLVVRGLVESFAALPPGAAFPAGAALALALRSAGELVSAAVAISAPAAAGVLAADLTLALVARVAPQLGAVNAAQPARAALGLFALAAAAGAAGGRLVQAVALSGSAAGGIGGAP
jgi:type III secretory pathway component EscT